MKTQRGYTLAEFMLALTIIGILAVALTVIVPQMTSVPEKGGVKMDALQNLQNAIHYLGFDAASAQSAVGGGSLTMTMPDTSVVTYVRSGNILCRQSGSGNQTVARDITDVSFIVSSRMITVNITAVPENRWSMSESRTYQVLMRPSGT